MRGLPERRIRLCLLFGITPAHAGLTPSDLLRWCLSWDHPRACGAYLLLLLFGLLLLGSPPRMRGLRGAGGAGGVMIGITPAHAGLTCLRVLNSEPSRDHPRACGAYIMRSYVRESNMGSPPRMRGLPLIFRFRGRICGITPAHAGLTRYASSASTPSRDHPRACGAYPTRTSKSLRLKGSPPRMRGLRFFGNG